MPEGEEGDVEAFGLIEAFGEGGVEAAVFGLEEPVGLEAQGDESVLGNGGCLAAGEEDEGVEAG